MAIARAALAVHHHNFNIPVQSVMLQAVVAENQIAAGIFQQVSGRPITVRVHHHRTQ